MSSIDANRLTAETMIQTVRWVEETGSTNSDALAFSWINESQFPLLIGADRQTQGRGRGTNAWWSATGGLTFSLVIRPERFGIGIEHWPRISLAVGVAAAGTIDRLSRRPMARLKWPNDVYLEGRKVCGILVESAGQRLERLVIGIGLNVNNSLRDAPPELHSVMTSLAEITGETFDRTDVLVQLLQSLESELTALGNLQGSHEQLARFREYCLLTGRFVTVSDPSCDQTGLCLGIDDDGALSLQTEFGRTRCLSGTVRLVDLDPEEIR